MKKLCLLSVVFLMSCFAMAQDHSVFSKEIFIKNKDTLHYRMLLPENFSEDKSYPVVLFLHGAGERGNDNERQLTHGSELFLNAENRKAFPAIVIFPQCPKNDYWASAEIDRTMKPIGITFPLENQPTTSMKLVMELMDEFSEKAFVNTRQIYVGGLSMGGMGTFEILYRQPNRYAAAITICGGGNPETAKFYANSTALWSFHGAKDDVVNPQLSLNMISAYLQAGGTPNFTLYADDNHNSWDSAFAEPELLTWLFSKSKH